MLPLRLEDKILTKDFNTNFNSGLYDVMSERHKRAKRRKNSYHKKNTRMKFAKDSLIGWKVYDNKPYLVRFSLSGCRGFAKRETNRRIRQDKTFVSNKPGAYRRVFDYWDTLF